MSHASTNATYTWRIAEGANMKWLQKRGAKGIAKWVMDFSYAYVSEHGEDSTPLGKW